MLKTFLMVVGGLGALASAQVSVEPDAFAPGTDLTNAFAGVTLTSSSSGPVFAFIAPAGRATTGRLVFGNRAFSGFEDEWGAGAPTFRADFAAPVLSVSIDVIGNDSFDLGSLRAFDASNNLLDTALTGALVTNQFQRLTVSSGSQNIAYVIASGDLGGTESISLDNMSYVVPAPGTLVLAGLIGLVGTRRRN